MPTSQNDTKNSQHSEYKILLLVVCQWMYLGYSYDINIIVNSLVSFWRTLLLVLNAFETISELLVQCVHALFAPDEE